MELGGAYTADRAAALSGVPKTAVHYWARKGYLVPSVSTERPKLWSFDDLIGLRMIYWLRQPETALDGREIPRSKMPIIKRAITKLRKLDLELFEEGYPTVAVDRGGEVLIDAPGIPLQNTNGQILQRDFIDIIAPFETLEGGRGPDLKSPRRCIRILPRKLCGAPHIENTRVETLALYTLFNRGFSKAKILSFYPFLDAQSVSDSVDLEQQLARNVTLSVAA